MVFLKKYVGHTGNKFGVRKGQHNTDILNSHDCPASKGQTALVRHFQDGHAPDFEKASILDVEPIEFKRKVLESLHILTNDTMNFRQYTDNIDTVYHSILH